MFFPIFSYFGPEARIPVLAGGQGPKPCVYHCFIVCLSLSVVKQHYVAELSALRRYTAVQATLPFSQQPLTTKRPYQAQTGSTNINCCDACGRWNRRRGRLKSTNGIVQTEAFKVLGFPNILKTFSSTSSTWSRDLEIRWRTTF